MSDSSGFAVSSPRADSETTAEIRPVGPPQRETGAYERTAEPEGELMMARGPSEFEPAEREPIRPSTEPRQPSSEEPHEPRIEKYRER
jgi:hypothetical protein